jgi:phage tail sheath gpL-like
MTISFNQIPIDLRVPGFYGEIDNSKAYRGLSGMPTKVLVIGQKLAAGSADPLVPQLITNTAQANAYFGRGSLLANMLERFKKANSFIECWAIPQVDDGAAVAAAGSVSFVGPATASGTLNFYVAGRRVRTKVTSGDAATAIATAFAAALTAELDLPVTAVVDDEDTFVVNITARNKGECGNVIDLRFNYNQDEFTPAGVVPTITAMSGGSANPDIDDVITAIGDEWYTDFVLPYTDSANITAMAEELDERWGALKMIEGMCWTALANTHANLVTSGQSRNSHLMTFMGEYKSPVPPYEWAAIYGAVAAYALKIDPARPVQTLALTGILPPPVANRFTIDEQNILLNNGISTFSVDAGNVVRIQRAVTAYRENELGAADPSYLDVETIKTLSFLRYDLRTFIALRYPRYKLADDGTNFGAGQAIVTPKIIRAALVARFKQWEEAGLVENISQFIADLIVERDSNDVNRINVLVPPDIINQLRVFAAKIEFRL